MKKRILITSIGLISIFFIFLVILNVSFGSYQNDKAAKRYNEEFKEMYSNSDNVFNEQYSVDYKSRMYVSKENKDWLISDYEDGVSVNRYLGKDKEIDIPETLDGKKVLRLDFNFTKQPEDTLCHDGPHLYDYYHCAFDNTDIELITIPSGVKDIRYGTFSNIASSEKPTLKKVTVSKENKVFYSNNDGELFIKENDEMIYSYKIEKTYYQKFSRFPDWMFFIYNLVQQ